MRILLLISCFCLFLIPTVLAQQPSPTVSGAAAEQSTAPAPATSDEIVPVPEPSEKALQYHRSGLVLWVIDLLWGFAIAGLFLFTGFSARIRTWAQAIGKKWFFVIGIYFAIFSIITFVIDFPLSYYEEFSRQHAYGLSNQSFGKWFSDSIIGLLLGIVGGFLFIWIPYLLLKKSP